MFLLYKIGIRLYYIAIFFASYRSEKTKQWLKGRKNQAWNFRQKGERWVWFHCASLGEFEQGRPVMEAFRKQNPAYKILLSFFSPSGYEIRKNYSGADQVIYLPLDTPQHVKHFINYIQPELAVIVKYEFWFGYLIALKEKSIPTYLISSRFRENQHFFKPWGTWFRKQLDCFTGIHVQDLESEKLLHKAGYLRTVVSGDSRYDRVFSNAQHPTHLPEIENWLNGRNALIAGSTWAEDDTIIFPWISEEWALIVAPHEISEERIREIETNCKRSSKRYSQLIQEGGLSDVLILDNMGMLLSAYSLGKIAYVGGAFGKGLHNILEPAACGLPVIFGPNYSKFLEAEQLIQVGGGISVSTSEEFLRAFEEISNPITLEEKSNICSSFVESKTGATKKILQSICPQ